MFETLLDPIFSPLLAFDPIYTILIISLLISVMVTFIYKWTTDQTKMKAIKDQMKKYQEDMKKLRKEPEKMMKVQKKAMKKNMEYMKMSMKSTLFTIIPIILIFGWLKMNVAFLPIIPGEEFSVTAYLDKEYSGDVSISVFGDNLGLDILGNITQSVEKGGDLTWRLKGDEGIYILNIKADNEVKQKKIIISYNNQYAEVDSLYKTGSIERVTTNHREIQPLLNIPLIGSIPWIRTFGWFGTYILFSIVFSISLRKIMKLH